MSTVGMGRVSDAAGDLANRGHREDNTENEKLHLVKRNSVINFFLFLSLLSQKESMIIPSQKPS